MTNPALNIHITTFNCGRAQIDVPYFSAHLLRDLPSTLPPDLLVLSLQELAPLSYSFLGGSSLAPYFSRFASAVFDAAATKFGNVADYENVLVRNVGMTAIMIFARREISGRIRRMETGGVGCGLRDMGNKGAVGVRLALKAARGGRRDAETVLTFVAAHLAPMEEACERRNADWKAICEGLVFERDGDAEKVKGGIAPIVADGEREPLLSHGKTVEDESSLFYPPSYIFFAGDLNYRTADISPKNHPESTNVDKWPQPNVPDTDPRSYAKHIASDQLTRELQANKTLHNLSEAPISFPPTYKYSAAAQKAALHAVTSQTRTLADGRTNTITKYTTDEPETAHLWATHRKPSWCDRILWLAAASPEVHFYTALPVQPTSDHRPVVLSISVPDAPLQEMDVQPPFPIVAGWRARRANARRYELLVGWAAYLSWTWEGEALLVGTLVGVLGGYVVLRYALLATA